MVNIFNSLFVHPLPITIFVINVIALYYFGKAIIFAVAILFGFIATLIGKNK